MSTIKGVVYKVFTRPAGRGTAYSIKLDGDAVYYGTGFKAPPVTAGQYISFEASKNARGHWDAEMDTIKILPNEVQVQTTGSGMSITKDDYWKRKEDRDLLNDKLRNVGARTNTAIAFVELLIKADAVKLPAKQSDREEVIAGLVKHYTDTIGMPDKEQEAVAVIAEVVEETGDWK
jgi:hypothetical protein